MTHDREPRFRTNSHIRLLVTGGTGFLGSRVVARAVAEGWDVTGTSRVRAAPRLELARPESVRELVLTLAPHAVVHTAYVKDVPEMDDVIVGGSGAVAEACAQLGARLVHVSSDVVFSGRAGRPYVETDPTDPINAYGRAKAEAEVRVLEADPGAAVVRTSLLLGGSRDPGQHERLAHDPAVRHWSDVVRCPICADDLAAALVELVGTNLAGPLHVAGPDAVTRAQLAELVLGSPVRAGPAPYDMPRDVRLDCSRAGEVLRTRLRGAREVLAR